MTPATSLFTPVEADLQILADNLKQLVGNRHPILYAAAEHLFGAGGKRIRPAIVLLISRATMLQEDITPRHRRLAEIKFGSGGRREMKRSRRREERLFPRFEGSKFEKNVSILSKGECDFEKIFSSPVEVCRTTIG